MKTQTEICRSLKPGYYLEIHGDIDMIRCYYATGTTKGNKWIELRHGSPHPNPEWMSLMWNAVPDMKNATYYEENPTNYPLNIKQRL